MFAESKVDTEMALPTRGDIKVAIHLFPVLAALAIRTLLTSVEPSADLQNDVGGEAFTLVVEVVVVGAVSACGPPADNDSELYVSLASAASFCRNKVVPPDVVARAGEMIITIIDDNAKINVIPKATVLLIPAFNLINIHCYL